MAKNQALHIIIKLPNIQLQKRNCQKSKRSCCLLEQVSNLIQLFRINLLYNRFLAKENEIIHPNIKFNCRKRTCSKSTSSIEEVVVLWTGFNCKLIQLFVLLIWTSVHLPDYFSRFQEQFQKFPLGLNPVKLPQTDSNSMFCKKHIRSTSGLWSKQPDISNIILITSCFFW